MSPRQQFHLGSIALKTSYWAYQQWGHQSASQQQVLVSQSQPSHVTVHRDPGAVGVMITMQQSLSPWGFMKWIFFPKHPENNQMTRLILAQEQQLSREGIHFLVPLHSFYAVISFFANWKKKLSSPCSMLFQMAVPAQPGRCMPVGSEAVNLLSTAFSALQTQMKQCTFFY